MPLTSKQEPAYGQTSKASARGRAGEQPTPDEDYDREVPPDWKLDQEIGGERLPEQIAEVED